MTIYDDDILQTLCTTFGDWKMRVYRSTFHFLRKREREREKRQFSLGLVDEQASLRFLFDREIKPIWRKSFSIFIQSVNFLFTLIEFSYANLRRNFTCTLFSFQRNVIMLGFSY